MNHRNQNSEGHAVNVTFERRLILLEPAVGLAEIARKAGGIAYSIVLGNKIFSITDSLLAAWIQYDDDSLFCRSRQQKQLNAMFGEGLLTKEGPEWSQIHDSVNNSFTRKNISKYHSRILEAIDCNIEQSMSADQAIHLQPAQDAVGWSIGTMSAVLLGERLGDTTIQRILTARQSSEETQTQQAARHGPFTLLMRRMKRLNSLLEEVVDEPVRKALAQDPDEHPNLLLDINAELQREARCPFSRVQHKDMVRTLFLAGILTTAYTLDWILILLSRHPQYWQKLADAVRPQLKALHPSIQEMEKLDVVHNIVKEVMRLRPVIHTIQKGVMHSCEIAGVTAKPGDLINLSLYGMHNRNDYWDNPETFNPDRFKTAIKPQSFTPFGLGQHTCIGQHLAIHILTTTLIRLVQQFDIVANPTISLDTESTLFLRPTTTELITLKPLM